MFCLYFHASLWSMTLLLLAGWKTRWEVAGAGRASRYPVDRVHEYSAGRQQGKLCRFHSMIEVDDKWIWCKYIITSGYLVYKYVYSIIPYLYQFYPSAKSSCGLPYSKKLACFQNSCAGVDLDQRRPNQHATNGEVALWGCGPCSSFSGDSKSSRYGN